MSVTHDLEGYLGIRISAALADRLDDLTELVAEREAERALVVAAPTRSAVARAALAAGLERLAEVYGIEDDEELEDDD